MVSYRLDLIDKLVIAITCVIVTFICVFNTFCFASEPISVPGVQFNGYSGTGGSIGSSANNKGVYFPIQSGITYTLTSNHSAESYVYFTVDTPSLGASVITNGTIPSNSSIDITPSDNEKYILVMAYSSNPNFYESFTLTYYPQGLSSVVDDLVSNVGINNIWDTFSISLPYVGVVVLAGFGFYLIFHNIKEISKGREKMN